MDLMEAKAMLKQWIAEWEHIGESGSQEHMKECEARADTLKMCVYLLECIE